MKLIHSPPRFKIRIHKSTSDARISKEVLTREKQKIDQDFIFLPDDIRFPESSKFISSPP